jgi:hypothetical protein
MKNNLSIKTSSFDNYFVLNPPHSLTSHMQNKQTFKNLLIKLLGFQWDPSAYEIAKSIVAEMQGYFSPFSYSGSNNTTSISIDPNQVPSSISESSNSHEPLISNTNEFADHNEKPSLENSDSNTHTPTSAFKFSSPNHDVLNPKELTVQVIDWLNNILSVFFIPSSWIFSLLSKYLEYSFSSITPSKQLQQKFSNPQAYCVYHPILSRNRPFKVIVMTINLPSYYVFSDSPILSSLALFVNWRGYLSSPSQIYAFNHSPSNISRAIWGNTLDNSLGSLLGKSHPSPYTGFKWMLLRLVSFMYILFSCYIQAVILQSVCALLTWLIYRIFLRFLLTDSILFILPQRLRVEHWRNTLNNQYLRFSIKILEEFVIYFLMLSGFHSLISLQFGHSPFILGLVATHVNFHLMVIILFKHNKSFERWNILSFFIIWISLLYTVLYPTGMVSILCVLVSVFLFLIILYVFVTVEVPEDDYDIIRRRREQELQTEQGNNAMMEGEEVQTENNQEEIGNDQEEVENNEEEENELIDDANLLIEQEHLTEIIHEHID